jgi:hypothetical protein
MQERNLASRVPANSSAYMGTKEILLFGVESPSPIFASSRDPDEQLMTFLTNWFVSHT